MGGVPALTAYWANALSIGLAGVLVTAACFALSVAQRRLSTPVRTLRRRTATVEGTQTMEERERRAADEGVPRGTARRSPAFARAGLVLLATGLVIVRL